MANKEDPNRILDYIMTTHAPLINMHIAKLKAAGKIPEGVEDEDLHEPALHGLMEAVAKYSPDIAANTSSGSKNPFAAYAGSRIQGKILDHVDKMHQVPKNIRQRAKRFNELQGMLANKAPATEAPTSVAPTSVAPAPVEPVPEE